MYKLIVMLLVIVAISCTACTLRPPAPKPLQVNPPAQGNAAPPARQNDNSALEKFAKGFDGKMGLYAKNLKTGNDINLGADDIFPTASTHKLVAALAVYKYLYQDASLEKKQRFDQNIKKMMQISDNPAYYELIEDIKHSKPQALTQVLADLGLVQTRIHSGEAFKQYGYHSVTTPREMAIVFETIYNEQYLGREMSAILKEELAKTIFRDEIPRFMQGNKVMHKVGQLPDGILNDVGIVDDGSNVILVSAYTKTKRTPAYASEFIATLAAKSYDVLRAR